MRHCRLAFSMASELSLVTRWLDFDCSMDLENLTSPLYMAYSMLLRQENAIPQLVDEALIAMRLKTFLLVP